MKPYRDPVERIMELSEWQGPCLVWTLAKDKDGYGAAKAERRMVRVHRFMWERLVGPIPDGMHLDHLCLNRACWFSDHLRVLSPGDNTRAMFRGRRAHCPKGHPFNAANTRLTRQGYRRCRTCDETNRKLRRASHSGMIGVSP